jgi:dipeptide transport system substrate-binding protein
MTIDHSEEFIPMTKNVTGYFQDPVGVHRFDGVDIAE